MYNNLKEKMDKKTMENVKKRRYFRIMGLNFILCILSGEVVDLFEAIISGNWEYYFTLGRILDSLDLYIFLAIAFTILIIFKNPYRNYHDN